MTTTNPLQPTPLPTTDGSMLTSECTIAWGHERPPKLEEYLCQFPATASIKRLQWQDAPNILEFLKVWGSKPSTNIILVHALTRYTTEAIYREALAQLYLKGSSGTTATIIEDSAHPSTPMIFRAARALGIENKLLATRCDNKLFIKIQRNPTPPSDHYWQNPAPFINSYSDATVEQTVINSIKQKSPLSLVRIGHCEVRFLGHQYFYGDSDIKKSSEIQWGNTPPEFFIEKVKNDLRRTVKNAQLLGFKIPGKISSHPLQTLDNSVLRCLAAQSLLNGNQTQISPNVHFTLGQSQSFIECISKCDHVIIISPRVQVYEKLRTLRDSHTCTDHLPLLGEARIDGNQSLDERINRFIEIESSLRKIIKPGSVSLIGAGVAGKVYCEITRSLGGIGLDLGSTLDAWSGIDSRGSGFKDQLKLALENIQSKS